MNAEDIEPGRQYWVFDLGSKTLVTTISRTVYIKDTWLCHDNDTLIIVEANAFLSPANESP
jgi:hypothetical protein